MPDEVPDSVIVGPLLTLRALDERDLPDLLRWLADPEVVRFYGAPPADLDATRREYLEPDVNPVWRYAIEHEGRTIGEIQFGHAYPGEEFAWSSGIDIFIGEPDARDRGLGTEAVRTMLRYLFEERGCHRVTIDPAVDNARAIRAYEKAGFRLDGVLRHDQRIDGRWFDTHFMSILDHEWPAARANWAVDLDTRGLRLEG